jgi:glutamine amidotransferase
MITIIDYGAGNIKSVEKAMQFLGYEVKTSSDIDTICASEKLILPGVGSFGNAMEKLKSKKLDGVIKNLKVPLLGICLGLQLLFDYSEESNCAGLGILKGRIKKIPGERLKIPQMGWNSIDITREGMLFKEIKNGSYVYFVHSYYLDAEDKSIVSATVEYGTTLDVAIECGNIYATQFHPEKSGDLGLKILKNFAGL